MRTKARGLFAVSVSARYRAGAEGEEGRYFGILEIELLAGAFFPPLISRAIENRCVVRY